MFPWIYQQKHTVWSAVSTRLGWRHTKLITTRHLIPEPATRLVWFHESSCERARATPSGRSLSPAKTVVASGVVRRRGERQPDDDGIG
jgi:hypothetical protein